MYKALLVDDEPRILQGLLELIPWENFGIEIAGQAANGRVALDLLEQTKAQILITDIKMPEMDGLALIREAKSRFAFLKCVILSGFDDFALVKEAARIGIENYLLKPVEPDELSHTLLEMTAKIDQEVHRQIQLRGDSVILRNNILNLWLTGQIGEADFRQRAELLQLAIDEKAYVVCLIHPLFAEAESPSNRNLLLYAAENLCTELLAVCCRAIVVCDSMDQIAVIVQDDLAALEPDVIHPYLQQCVDSIRQYLKSDVFVTVGSRIADCGRVSESYAQAQQLMEYRLIMPPATIVDIRDREERTDSDMGRSIPYNRLAQLIIDREKEQATAFIADTFETICRTMTVSPLQVQNIAIELLYHMLTVMSRLKLESASLFDSQDHLAVQLIRRKSVDELSGWLQMLAVKTIDCIEAQESRESPLIKRVTDYIDEHYANNISLKTIAVSFNVNPAYLGQLFIKEKGDTFSNYLNAARIKRAAELLTTTEWDLSAIAEATGYVNQSYFSYLFKKTKGVYPTKFRLEHRTLN